jgi:hypothetical protein
LDELQPQLFDLFEVAIPLLLGLCQLHFEFGEALADGRTVLVPTVQLLLMAEMLLVQMVLLQEGLQNLKLTSLINQKLGADVHFRCYSIHDEMLEGSLFVGVGEGTGVLGLVAAVASVGMRQPIDLLLQREPFPLQGFEHLLQLCLLPRILVVGEELQVVLGLLLHRLKVPVDGGRIAEHPHQPLSLLQLLLLQEQMVLQQHLLTPIDFFCLVDIVDLFEQVAYLLVLPVELQPLLAVFGVQHALDALQLHRQHR